MNQPATPILQVLDAYKAAVLAKDVDALIALYDEHVCVFDMWTSWSYNGIAAWRTMVTAWFGSLGSDQVVVEMDEVRTIVAENLAVAYAFVTYKGLSAAGQELRAMQNWLTVALTQTEGVWKIVHEHSSAPASFETGQVMLRRA